MSAVENVCVRRSIATLWLYTRNAERIYARADSERSRRSHASGQDLRIDATRPDSVAISAMGYADARQCNNLIANAVNNPFHPSGSADATISVR